MAVTPTVEAVQVDLDTVRNDNGRPAEGALAALILLMKLFPVSIFTDEDPIEVSEWLGKHGINALVDLPVINAVRQTWNGWEGFVLVTDKRIRAVFITRSRAVPFTAWDETLSALGYLAGPEFQREALKAARGE
ncbi:MAG TPA: hypothetical protein VFI65_19305 [Streptosporangiaceae bacterium]|nr:hypothetical protein [Streptosporangiaceae bacterium]